MLERTLILMAIQWAGACLCYALARYGGTVGVIVASVLGVLGFLLSAAISPVELLQFLVVLAVAMVCLAVERQRFARFALFSIAGSVLALAVVDWYAQMVWATVAREFPLESLAARLAYETEPRRPQSTESPDDDTSPMRLAVLPSADALQKLDELYQYPSSRNIALRLAHASQVERFANIQDSFGVTRAPRIGLGNARRIDSPPVRLREVKLICADTEPAAVASPLLAPSTTWAEPFHGKSLVNFANRPGWGYVKDREHVAGFESHRFREARDDGREEQWQTIRVELVSLLKHDEPRVYISEYLPAMDELREAPVRPLDAFEERSLAALVQGGDIEVDVVGRQIRMLGAIRAAEKCLTCHTVEHGELLGAFSYVLLPASFVQK